VVDLEDVKVWVVKTTSLMIISRTVINSMNQYLVKGIILDELKVIDIVLPKGRVLGHVGLSMKFF
jgi:hypothetical protein